MTHETYGRASAVSLIADAFNDLSDLVRKEMRLASAEMSSAVTSSIRAIVVLMIGGAFLFMALLMAMGGLALVIVNYGFSLHAASFMVAGGIAVAGLVLILYARARISARHLAPTRAAGQMREAIRTAKEQMK
jgi:hypothetical protein